MSSDNRIQQTSVVTTVGRQTPKADFGDQLAHVLSQGAVMSAGIVRGAAGASPVVSAAVSGIGSVVSAVTPVSTQYATTQVSGYGAPAPNAERERLQSVENTSSNPDGFALLEAQKRQSNEYLNLQTRLQQESREYNTVTNILKLRHDSAKAAINNIR